jgi:hypothetical protein
VFCKFILNVFDLPTFHSPSSSSSSFPISYNFFFDNEPIHKGDIVEVIFSSGHTAIPLSPYSPPLNPILIFLLVVIIKYEFFLNNKATK